jgi:hypothetical protein
LRPEKSPSLVFFPTLEATIAIHLFKDRRDETASFKRYVIQWKQRSVQPVDFDSQNDSQNDETNWITSSVFSIYILFIGHSRGLRIKLITNYVFID